MRGGYDGEGNEGGAEHLDRKTIKASQDIYNAIKGFDANSIDNIEKNKIEKIKIIKQLVQQLMD